MPVKAPAPVAAPVYNWGGFYIGINGGYGWGDTSPSIAALDPDSATFLSGPPTWFSPGQFASSFNERGGSVGGQAGYNWQFSRNWVGGLETDIQYAHVQSDSSNVLFLNPSLFGTNFPFTVNNERTLEWFGTVRGRLGYLVTPDLLIYGTGGLAYGKTTASASILNSPAPGGSNSVNLGSFSCAATGPGAAACYAGSGSRTSVGWAAGAGVEAHLIGNFTAKLEYLYVDLGGQTITLISPPPSAPGVATTYSFGREAINIVRFGLNYKFN